jgi:hypothetical protein
MVIMRDGTRLLDRFIGGHARFIVLEEAGRIERKRIACISPINKSTADFYAEVR